MIRKCFAALAMLLPIASRAAPQSHAAFAGDMLRRLQAAMPDRTLRPDLDDAFSIEIIDSGPTELSHVNLHNLYVACLQATPRECRQEKARFVADICQPVMPVTAASLRLVVRSAHYVEAANAMVANDPDKVPVSESIGEQLYAMLASDRPTMTAMVSKDRLRPLDLSPAEAWSLARTQTAANLPAIPTAAKIERHVVDLRGFEYGASVLLDTAAWTRLAEAVGPDLFVTVVADDAVMVGTMTDTVVHSFRSAVEEDCAAQPHCISTHVYRFRDGRWLIAR